MLIKKSFTFHAAHRIMNHPGKCRNLHGHTYKVEVVASGQVREDTGMVIDFGLIAAAVQEELERWDHTTILQKGDPLLPALSEDMVSGKWTTGLMILQTPPTAECIAKVLKALIQGRMAFRLPEVCITGVIVHESPTSCAEAWGDD